MIGQVALVARLFFSPFDPSPMEIVVGIMPTMAECHAAGERADAFGAEIVNARAIAAIEMVCAIVSED